MPSASGEAVKTRGERARARPREILDAARKLFSEKGFEATRMDEVAAAIGVTKPAVYRYFPGKDRLIEALIEQDIAQPGRAINAWIADHPGPVQELVGGFSDRIGAMQSGGLARGYMLLAMDDGNRRPEIAGMIRDEILTPGLVALTTAFGRAQARGELAAGHDPELMGRMFFAPFLQTTLGTVGYAVPIDDAADRERYRAFHVAAFLRAFGT
jgi:AcrR family transcriptional regulator